MQKSISKAAESWRLILSVLLVGTLISCEDTNTVGGGVVEPTDVRIDTIEVSNFDELSGNMYSGGSSGRGDIVNISMGSYDDPLFGNHETIAYIKPLLISKPALELNDSTKMNLLLTFNKNNAYGDTTSSVNYSLYKVTDLWRGRSVFSDDQIAFDQSELVGSFTYTGEDSVDVEIAESFFLDYASYVNNGDNNRDSLYNFEFFGLSIVPDQVSAQIIYPNVNDSNFEISKIESDDTTSIGFREYAFTLTRDNPPAFNDRFLFNNYLSNFYRLSFADQVENLSDINILNAELYLYEDSTQVQNSLPSNHVRNRPSALEMKFDESQDLIFDTQFSLVDFSGIRDSSSIVYKFNVTNYINEYVFGNPANDDLILNLNPAGGIFRSTLLFDTSSTTALKPKIILTIAE